MNSPKSNVPVVGVVAVVSAILSSGITFGVLALVGTFSKTPPPTTITEEGGKKVVLPELPVDKEVLNVFEAGLRSPTVPPLEDIVLKEVKKNDKSEGEIQPYFLSKIDPDAPESMKTAVVWYGMQRSVKLLENLNEELVYLNQLYDDLKSYSPKRMLESEVRKEINHLKTQLEEAFRHLDLDRANKIRKLLLELYHSFDYPRSKVYGEQSIDISPTIFLEYVFRNSVFAFLVKYVDMKPNVFKTLNASFFTFLESLDFNNPMRERDFLQRDCALMTVMGVAKAAVDESVTTLSVLCEKAKELLVDFELDVLSEEEITDALIGGLVKQLPVQAARVFLQSDPSYYMRIRQKVSVFLEKAFTDLDVYGVGAYFEILVKAIVANGFQADDDGPEPRVPKDHPHDQEKVSQLVSNYYLPKIVSSLKRHHQASTFPLEELIVRGLELSCMTETIKQALGDEGKIKSVLGI